MSLTRYHFILLFQNLSLCLLRSLTLPHSYMYSSLNLSRFCFITLVASHTHTHTFSLFLSRIFYRSFFSQSTIISRPSKSSSLNTLISQSHAGRSRRLIYQAYLQHLSAGFGLGSFIGNIHLHFSSSIVDTRQTGTYLFSLSLSFALFLSLSLSFSLSRARSFSHSFSLTLFLAKYPFSRIIGCARRRYR